VGQAALEWNEEQNRMTRAPIKLALLAGIVTLAACEVGPDYAPPAVDAPPAYKEAGDWQKAQPNDAIDRGAWWSIYNDPVLDNLEKQIDISNQNLKAAEAAWREARAVVEESRSQLFPTVTLNGAGTRTGGGVTKPGPVNSFDLSAGASWVPDLWGRIRRTIESNIASAQASEADLALARLSAQAELATDYFSLRSQDELKYLLDLTVVADQKALQIVKNQYKAGVAAQADVLTAQTELESVQAQDINTGVLRAQLEHAIAVLAGKPPSEVSLVPAPLAENIPVVPPGVPSALLERRPDIAAAERQMAAANAQIGVAIAAYYPDLTLSASYGFISPMLGSLVQAPNSLWSFGPSLTETVFDAGLRAAQVEAARAAYDETVATYRQTVLTGFQQVEDELAALHILEQQAVVEEQTVGDAKKAEKLVLNQYQAGTVPYSSVLTAQIATLTNQQAALTVRENRFIASVALIEALGGGWNVLQLTTDHPKEERAPAATSSVSTDTKPAGEKSSSGSWFDNLF
jgi:NodT family efflux transporter outer membrane factor (OMF) lipoprotein